jgi:hypothetical protein
VNRAPASDPAWFSTYKLLEWIGEGGMGGVWIADKTEPIQRRVPVKVVKEGMDTKQVLARFAAERQALALTALDLAADARKPKSPGRGSPPRLSIEHRFGHTGRCDLLIVAPRAPGRDGTGG